MEAGKCSLYFRLKNDVTVTYDNNYVVNNIFENTRFLSKITGRTHE